MPIASEILGESLAVKGLATSPRHSMPEDFRGVFGFRLLMTALHQ